LLFLFLVGLIPYFNTVYTSLS